MLKKWEINSDFQNACFIPRGISFKFKMASNQVITVSSDSEADKVCTKFLIIFISREIWQVVVTCRVLSNA